MGPVGGSVGGQTMKRAFAVAVFGGLMAFLVPQVASADHAADHKSDCAGQPASADSPEQAPPQQHPYGDREEKDSDGSEILF